MDHKAAAIEKSNDPIGIFDSGVGGIGVFKEIQKQLPCESIVYFADSKNCPYGSKTAEDAFSLAREKIEFLLAHHCKLIVIACNTVTAVAIDRFRSEYKVPFIGMEPALKPAAQNTRTGKIGILATENTFNGKLFKQTFEKYAGNAEVIVQPGNGLAELVEQGRQETDQAHDLLCAYINPMLEKGADTLVLGCTHYPFLRKTIEKITQGRVTIIEPSTAVAAQTQRILGRFNLLSPENRQPSFSFFTTGNKSVVEHLLSGSLSLPYRLEQIDL